MKVIAKPRGIPDARAEGTQLQHTVMIYGRSIAHSYGEPNPLPTMNQESEKPLGMVIIYGSIPHYYVL